jgi:hypothetical protein
MELDGDVEIDYACNSRVRQRSGKHCTTLGDQLLIGLGEHLREATAPGRALAQRLEEAASTLASRRAGQAPVAFSGASSPSIRPNMPDIFHSGICQSPSTHNQTSQNLVKFEMF